MRKKMQLRNRAGTSFPSSALGEVFTASPGASLCPCHSCSHNRDLVAPGTVGIGKPSPVPRTNILHLTASELWPSAFTTLFDRMHQGFSCVNHHPWCYKWTGGLSLVADESLAASSFPRPASFQTSEPRYPAL